MTQHFRLQEFTHSLTAIQLKIDNTPSEFVRGSLQATAEGMERVKLKLEGKPVRITSGFRCEALNKAIGGSRTSQHLRGEACDFVCPAFGTPKKIVEHLAPLVQELGIDQIICEGAWIHISFTKNPRHQVLSYVGGKFVKGVV